MLTSPAIERLIDHPDQIPSQGFDLGDGATLFMEAVPQQGASGAGTIIRITMEIPIPTTQYAAMVREAREEATADMGKLQAAMGLASSESQERLDNLDKLLRDANTELANLEQKEASAMDRIQGLIETGKLPAKDESELINIREKIRTVRDRIQLVQESIGTNRGKKAKEEQAAYGPAFAYLEAEAKLDIGAVVKQCTEMVQDFIEPYVKGAAKAQALFDSKRNDRWAEASKAWRGNRVD